jgi:hypothetical protein
MNFHLSGPEEKVTRAVRVLFLETFQRRHFFLETSDQKAERERERESQREGRKNNLFLVQIRCQLLPKARKHGAITSKCYADTASNLIALSLHASHLF